MEYRTIYGMIQYMKCVTVDGIRHRTKTDTNQGLLKDVNDYITDSNKLIGVCRHWQTEFEECDEKFFHDELKRNKHLDKILKNDRLSQMEQVEFCEFVLGTNLDA